MAERRKRVLNTNTNENEPPITKKEIISKILNKPTKKKFLSDGQKIYYDKLIENEITICTGPAGVGKSYMAMKAAIDLLSDPTNSY
jgi:phosphate starvation-inducible protein PhoH